MCDIWLNSGLVTLHGPVVAAYTTTNTSQTEVIQTGLQCATNYYTMVVVTGGPGGTQMLSSDVQVLVGGNSVLGIVWM